MYNLFNISVSDLKGSARIEGLGFLCNVAHTFIFNQSKYKSNMISLYKFVVVTSFIIFFMVMLSFIK